MLGVKWVLGTLILLLLWLQYVLWFGEDTMVKTWQLKQTFALQSLHNQQLKKRNDVLIAEVNDLHQGHDAIEEDARQELGMMKDNEIYYQIIPTTPPSKK